MVFSNPAVAGFFFDDMSSKYKSKILAEFRGISEISPINDMHPIALGVIKFLQKAGLDQKAIESRIMTEWASIVGDFYAAQSTPLSIQNGALTVGVSHSIYIYEFERQKKALLIKIQNKIESKKIRKILFKVGAR